MTKTTKKSPKPAKECACGECPECERKLDAQARAEMQPQITPVPEPPTYAMVLGRVIRLRRELRGISATGMAEAVGLSVSGWTRTETGETSINADMLYKAAKILGLTPAALVRLADEVARDVLK